MPQSKKYKNKYRSEPNRWQFWDYSAPGSYFITICINNRECILGNIIEGKMYLSEYGEIVRNEFLKIPEYHKRVLLNVWIVMPNHVHCIITLGGYDFDNSGCNVGNGCVGKIHEFSLPTQYQPLRNQPTPPTLDDI